jgi:hypothetical protein
MWWFILIAVTLPVFGWLSFDIVSNLIILGRILSLFGLSRLRNVIPTVVKLMMMPSARRRGRWRVDRRGQLR